MNKTYGIVWTIQACSKCGRSVQVRESDGWTETHDCRPALRTMPCSKCRTLVQVQDNGVVELHDCEPKCASCGHDHFWHRPVCAGETESPYICLQSCERYVEVCEHCGGSQWLPERYVNESYPGRHWCVCRFDDTMKRLHSKAWATAQAVIALRNEAIGQLSFLTI